MAVAPAEVLVDLAAAGESGLYESLRGLYPDMQREFAEYMFSPESVAVATRAVYTSLLARAP